jgi:hypothetical protein
MKILLATKDRVSRRIAWYEHVRLGTNYRLTGWQATVLVTTPVHSKKYVLGMKTTHIGCHETDFHFELAICNALG